MVKKTRPYDGKTTEAKVRERRYPRRLTVKVVSEGHKILEERVMTFPLEATEDVTIKVPNPHKRFICSTKYYSFWYYDNTGKIMIVADEKRPEYMSPEEYKILLRKLIKGYYVVQTGVVPQQVKWRLSGVLRGPKSMENASHDNE